MSTDPIDTSSHLCRDESSPPAAVLAAEKFIKRLGIWFKFSRNHAARGCREAAHRRHRLGHEGIPLWDELKSSLGGYVDLDGKFRLVLAHCRADQRLNKHRLAVALGVDVEQLEVRLPKEELAKFHLEKGLINPWETWCLETRSGESCWELNGNAIEQVFDDDLLQPIGTPGTVMTNAGSLTWAVEFHARELVSKIPHAKVADIAEPDPDEEPRLWGVKDDRPIGIITGNPPEAGMSLWKLINGKVREALGMACCGDISMPRMEVVSVPEMGLSMELESRFAPVEAALEKAARELALRGVKLLALPCNTTSFFAPQIHQWCEGTQTRFLSMADATGGWLRREGVKKVALVGINYVADLGHWSAYREPMSGMEIELLDSDALGNVRKLADEVKQKGPSLKLLSKLHHILQRSITSRNVVLALTELSLLVELQRGEDKSGKLFTDPMRIYADALVRAYLGLPGGDSI